MDLHNQRKSEIDAREEGFSSVVLMGKTLLARNHYASEDVSSLWDIVVITGLGQLPLISGDYWRVFEYMQTIHETHFYPICAISFY